MRKSGITVLLPADRGAAALAASGGTVERKNSRLWYLRFAAGSLQPSTALKAVTHYALEALGLASPGDGPAPPPETDDPGVMSVSPEDAMRSGPSPSTPSSRETAPTEDRTGGEPHDGVSPVTQNEPLLRSEVDRLIRSIVIRGGTIHRQGSKDRFTLHAERGGLVFAYVRPDHITFVMQQAQAEEAIARGAELEGRSASSWYVRCDISDADTAFRWFLVGLKALTWAEVRYLRSSGYSDPEPAPKPPLEHAKPKAKPTPEEEAAEERRRKKEALDARYGLGWEDFELGVPEYLDSVKEEARHLRGYVDLRNYWHRRRTTIQELLGVGQSSQGDHATDWANISMIDELIEVLSHTLYPLAGALEVPRIFVELTDTPHWHQLTRASRDRDEAILGLVAHIIERHYPNARTVRATWGQMLTHGIEPHPPSVPWDDDY